MNEEIPEELRYLYNFIKDLEDHYAHRIKHIDILRAQAELLAEQTDNLRFALTEQGKINVARLKRKSDE